MSHTPGPWQMTPSDPSWGASVYWITAMPYMEKEVATVAGPQNGTNEANARLIAAAPDLLTFAESVLMYCNDPRVVADAEIVVKKARGES